MPPIIPQVRRPSPRFRTVSVWWGTHSCLPSSRADRNVCPTERRQCARIAQPVTGTFGIENAHGRHRPCPGPDRRQRRPYGVRLLEVLLRLGRTVHLTISPAAVQVMERELERRVSLERFDLGDLLGNKAPTLPGRVEYHVYRDFQAGIASGSFLTARHGRSARAAWAPRRPSPTACRRT